MRGAARCARGACGAGGDSGASPHATHLVFAGQRLERCLLKTVVHAAALGFECTVVEEACYAKEDEADAEWSASQANLESYEAAGRVMTDL